MRYFRAFAFTVDYAFLSTEPMLNTS